MFISYKLKYDTYRNILVQNIKNKDNEIAVIYYKIITSCFELNKNKYQKKKHNRQIPQDKGSCFTNSADIICAFIFVLKSISFRFVKT